MKSGIIVGYKPKGPTSHDVVEEVRRKLKIRKVGHAGTLDPFAEGVLILGINQGTRVLEFYKDKKKIYWVKMKLGVITETFDITGEIVEERDCNVTCEEIKKTLLSFVGEYLQVPPAYSARKYKGERLYKLAREGKIIRLPPKKVFIYKIWDIEIEDDIVSFRVETSPGTYVRSLCMDIGYKLGCGATALELVRESVGEFSVDISINVFEASPEELENSIISLDKTLEWLPALVITENWINKILNGNQLFLEGVSKVKGTFKKGDYVRLIDNNGKLIAIAIAERNSKFLETLKRQKRNERITKLYKVFKERYE
ncbi:MAG TPA: tRNA pseudouridine(55) synthase TruB [Thermotoga sp.]|nr:tRNA pseudouridine(55) synthase TruB [Thermotoga sp.]